MDVLKWYSLYFIRMLSFYPLYYEGKGLILIRPEQNFYGWIIVTFISLLLTYEVKGIILYDRKILQSIYCSFHIGTTKGKSSLWHPHPKNSMEFVYLIISILIWSWVRVRVFRIFSIRVIIPFLGGGAIRNSFSTKIVHNLLVFFSIFIYHCVHVCIILHRLADIQYMRSFPQDLNWRKL